MLMNTVKPLLSITKTLSDTSPAAIDLVTRAYIFAENAHKEQKRYSGDPYFLHVAEVGFELANIGMDAQTVAAGLLHDVIEDVHVSPETIEKEFGPDVLHLVDGVTKLGAVRYHGMERHAESLRKLFAATAKDIRVLIIKLIDRLHNVRTLQHVPAAKRGRIALETLELYAPIADRLGMGVIKSELEDAAFEHAYPKEFAKVSSIVDEHTSENEKRLEKMEKSIKKELAQAGIRTFHTESRIKGMYSLWKKLDRKENDITKIHDVLAIRIVVPDVALCYQILGIIHAQWRPVPGKIKDYIAFPKPSGYQSIHTTVYTGDGSSMEIQIRTESMNKEAQFGIASHFGYKESQDYHQGDKKGNGIEWVRSLLPTKAPTRSTPHHSYDSGAVPQWIKDIAHHEAEGHDAYLDDLKADFFTHRVFVFTPRNDVIDLPMDASPVDFAYAIHSDIGNRTSGAKVNGKMVSLDSKLRNGDLVEIIVSKNAKPNKKWLEFIKTSMARNQIKHALKLK
jgi:GTP diphosphokinase / guanosine-3',5'-bis(diphosphate) 3'-diphosphatase